MATLLQVFRWRETRGRQESESNSAQLKSSGAGQFGNRDRARITHLHSMLRSKDCVAPMSQVGRKRDVKALRPLARVDQKKTRRPASVVAVRAAW